MPVTVYLQDPDVTLYHGDALETLRSLPDESVHCVVTSPPYWGLRDYGTGLWDGGDPDCDHTPSRQKTNPCGQGEGGNTNWGQAHSAFRDVCGKCGAHRTDNQLGLEPTPELYVQNMVAVFREVRRVLRRDGTCWLNIGDSYNANQGAGFNAHEYTRPHLSGEGVGQKRIDERNRNTTRQRPPGIKPKDLVGIPWRLAFALQADGWWLRADIIWAKPNPMPESVTDRPTKAHEYVFLLTRQPRYYFDQEAVREPANPETQRATIAPNVTEANTNGIGGTKRSDFEKARRVVTSRNVRSVWEIATEPFPAAHFATFPTELARRCILAGTSERGCCPECGAPWVRVVERESVQAQERWSGAGRANGCVAGGGHEGRTGQWTSESQTLGWRPTCDHKPAGSEGLNHPGIWEFTHPPVPCTVLDPFAGACTVPHTARKHGRHSIGIELSETYLRDIALPRLQQLSLLA